MIVHREYGAQSSHGFHLDTYHQNGVELNAASSTLRATSVRAHHSGSLVKSQ